MGLSLKTLVVSWDLPTILAIFSWAGFFALTCTGDRGGDIAGEFGLVKGGEGLCGPGETLCEPLVLCPDAGTEKSTMGVGSAWKVVNALERSSS